MKYLVPVALALFAGGVVWFAARQRAMLREMWLFLKAEKAWWLAPIVVVLLLVAVLVMLGSNPALMPFIYPIF